jgi:hypothetical protein
MGFKTQFKNLAGLSEYDSKSPFGKINFWSNDPIFKQKKNG